MNVAEILDGAADLIERGKWRHGWDDYGHCAATAIFANETPMQWTALLSFARALYGDENPYRVYLWNDDPRRTKAEVVSMLRAVAMSERARAAVPVREQATA